MSDDTPSRKTLGNYYAQLYQRYINRPLSSSENSDVRILAIHEDGRNKKPLLCSQGLNLAFF